MQNIKRRVSEVSEEPLVGFATIPDTEFGNEILTLYSRTGAENEIVDHLKIIRKVIKSGAFSESEVEYIEKKIALICKKLTTYLSKII